MAHPLWRPADRPGDLQELIRRQDEIGAALLAELRAVDERLRPELGEAWYGGTGDAAQLRTAVGAGYLNDALAAVWMSTEQLRAPAFRLWTDPGGSLPREYADVLACLHREVDTQNRMLGDDVATQHPVGLNRQTHEWFDTWVEGFATRMTAGIREHEREHPEPDAADPTEPVHLEPVRLRAAGRELASAADRLDAAQPIRLSGLVRQVREPRIAALLDLQIVVAADQTLRCVETFRAVAAAARAAANRFARTEREARRAAAAGPRFA